ncbi:hypothetical protein P4571_06550 [Niallia alba]|uniref:hypothetical protein n=1 Tax=Niallia alba TaxID=2729105 RepID=UPI002E236CF5|nr:hypothetical protein [Niallia alba]
MPIKTVAIQSSWLPSADGENDCIVFRKGQFVAEFIDMSFPFHEDTPNFRLSIKEAMNLRNALDDLIDIKLLDKPGGIINDK